MEVSHEASVRVSRGVHCMLSSCSGDRELPGGHAPWARGAGGLPAGLPQRHSRSLRSEKESCTLHGACV